MAFFVEPRIALINRGELSVNEGEAGTEGATPL